MNDLDVVIVTAEGAWELVRDCLDSLCAHPPATAHMAVHVVDNASRDGTPDRIRARYPDVNVAALDRNSGFGYASNYGVKRTHAPFVLLLNPDTVLQAGAIDTLLGAFARTPRAAVVGPRLLRTDGSLDHNAKRSFPSPSAAFGHLIRGATPGRLRSGSGYSRADIDECADAAVEAVSGACMLVRRAALPDVGLLDEHYWMYGEDLDWCRRFLEHGWEVRYIGGATVVHVGHGVTGARRSVRVNWAFHRAMGRFYRRWEAGERPLLDLAVYAAVLLRFALSTLCATLARGREDM